MKPEFLHEFKNESQTLENKVEARRDTILYHTETKLHLEDLQL